MSMLSGINTKVSRIEEKRLIEASRQNLKVRLQSVEVKLQAIQDKRYNIKLTRFSKIPNFFFNLDATTLISCVCANKIWNKNITKLVTKMTEQDLLEICSPSLRIIDAKAMGLNAKDEPAINQMKVLRAVMLLAPRVEDGKGVTLLTIKKDWTHKSLADVAKKTWNSMGSDFSNLSCWTEILKQQRAAPIPKTYRKLFANNIDPISRHCTSVKQKEAVLKKIHCENPSLLELMALCIYTWKTHQIYLFEKGLNKDGLETHVISSTKTKQVPVLLGDFSEHTLGAYFSDGPYFQKGTGPLTVGVAGSYKISD